jgi:outer membrane protein OmpA-like peptidoglycan-associated protein
MKRLTLSLAGFLVFAAGPALAQVQERCPTTGGAATSQPAWVMFDLGSAVLRAADKPVIAKAVQTAKDRQAVKVCLIGQTDKLGSKELNDRLALQRSQAVAAEMIKAGYPGAKIVIATNPEAFGDIKFGGADAQEKDRRVTIVFR